ncbi:hypothetical protein F2P81_001630 [Scophthalmus maximus]|uniref:Uncharacterized protein n=1 Tax=Scophthalmus maximus TaxID=52904 RepID=A0A6A4TQR0_SCOMX|nr:hypothetical protein F2P81_001630 [Scophthalmus maximus]
MYQVPHRSVCVGYTLLYDLKMCMAPLCGLGVWMFMLRRVALNGYNRGNLRLFFVSADSVKAALCAEERRSTAEAQLEESPECVIGVRRELEFDISI